MNQPSDTELIDWVERGGHRVAPGLASEDRGMWLVFDGRGWLVAIAKGTTWRMAVENAMRIEQMP